MNNLIGLDKQTKSLRHYINGRIDTEGVILHGPPGTGKSTLANNEVKAYGFDVLSINLADERKKADTDRNVKTLMTASLFGKPRIAILEGADGAKDKTLLPYINSKTPTIIICHDIKSIPSTIKTRCHTIKFAPPKEREYKQNMPADAPFDLFNSWRDALNWKEGGDAEGPLNLSPFEEARRIFAGKTFPEHFPPQISTDQLLWFASENGLAPELVSRLDMLLHKSVIHKNAARDILFTVRIEKVGYKSSPKRRKVEIADPNIPLKIISIG